MGGHQCAPGSTKHRKDDDGGMVSHREENPVDSPFAGNIERQLGESRSATLKVKSDASRFHKPAKHGSFKRRCHALVRSTTRSAKNPARMTPRKQSYWNDVLVAERWSGCLAINALANWDSDAHGLIARNRIRLENRLDLADHFRHGLSNPVDRVQQPESWLDSYRNGALESHLRLRIRASDAAIGGGDLCASTKHCGKGIRRLKTL